MKRINPRLAKLHRSYTTQELADLLSVHKNTVTGWLKAGLPRIDGTRPLLIHGDEFQGWWSSQRKAAKRPCRPGQLYCLKCREPKAPALDMVEYASANAATGNLKAMCETCGTMMHRRTRLTDIAAKMPGLEVRCTQVPPGLTGRAQPSSDCDNLAGA